MYWAPPAVPQEPPSIERRNSRVPSVLALVGVVVLVFTFLTPWYTMNLTGQDVNRTTVTEYVNFNTFTLCANATGTNTGGSSASFGGCFLYVAAGGIGFVFLAAAGLFLLGMVLGIVGGLLGLGAASQRGPVTGKKVKRPYTFTLLAFVLVLVSLLLFVVMDVVLVGMVGASFCNAGSSASGVMGSCPFTLSAGSGDQVTGTMTWGPGMALFIALLGLVLLAVAMVRLRGYYHEMRVWDPSLAPPVAPAPMTYPGY